VPVTAKLSKKFYDTLGDEVTNEPVAWLNAVDESYRSEFRDLFAANFGRPEAEMPALQARLQADIRALEGTIEAKIDKARSETEQRLLVLEAQMAAFETRIDARLGRFEARMLRWMLVFWAGTMGTVIALLKL
jgi:hypothetical protein